MTNTLFWSQTTDLPSPRYDNPLVTGLDGTVYSVCGANQADNTNAVLYTLDTTTKVWSIKADPTSVFEASYAYSSEYNSFAAAVGTDGIVYLFVSGIDQPYIHVYAYNPTTDTWTAKTFLTGLNYNKIQSMTAVTGIDGIIYIVAGTLDEQGGMQQTNIFTYTSATDTWYTGRAFLLGADAQWFCAVAIGRDRCIYLMGGADDSSAPISTVRAYDTIKDIFTVKTSLPVALMHSSAVTGPDGTIYYIAGAIDDIDDTVNTVYAYTPWTDTWVEEATVNASQWSSATLGLDGAIYVSSGNDNEGQGSATVYMAKIVSSGLFLGKNRIKTVYRGSSKLAAVYHGANRLWGKIPPLAGVSIGDAVMGGFYAGIIDTTKGNIESDDYYQTGSRYALIVSPKSLESGYTISGVYPDPSWPAGVLTRWNGLGSTNAMVSAGTGKFAAAEYCAGLTYDSDGGSEWYLPALDELELLYRNFKPTTTANATSTETGTTFPATAQAAGYNPSSDPVGTAYTSSDPPITTVADFLPTGTDYFEYLSVASSAYFTSTPTATGTTMTYAWVQEFGDQGVPGSQFIELAGNHGDGALIRPVRRLVLS